MPGPKLHVLAALRLLDERKDKVYAALGEAMYLEDFRTAYVLGAVFPDFHYHAPFQRWVTHDDDKLLACAGCLAPVKHDARRCTNCNGKCFPGVGDAGSDFDARYIGGEGEERVRVTRAA